MAPPVGRCGSAISAHAAPPIDGVTTRGARARRSHSMSRPSRPAEKRRQGWPEAARAHARLLTDASSLPGMVCSRADGQRGAHASGTPSDMLAPTKRSYWAALRHISRPRTWAGVTRSRCRRVCDAEPGSQDMATVENEHRTDAHTHEMVSHSSILPSSRATATTVPSGQGWMAAMALGRHGRAEQRCSTTTLPST
jgi:hypothetical protein